MDTSLTIEYVIVSPVSGSVDSNVISTAVSSFVDAVWSLVVGVSLTAATVYVIVEVLLSSVPSLALYVNESVPL